MVFDRAAEQVCRRCILRDTCWRQNYSATYNAFNDACPRLLQRGVVQQKSTETDKLVLAADGRKNKFRRRPIPISSI